VLQPEVYACVSVCKGARCGGRRGIKSLTD
jgi:hypothetical protein